MTFQQALLPLFEDTLFLEEGRTMHGYRRIRSTRQELVNQNTASSESFWGGFDDVVLAR